MIIKASVLACKQHSSVLLSCHFFPPTFDSNMFACGTPLLMTLHVHIYKNTPVTTLSTFSFPFLFLKCTCILSPFKLWILLPFMCFPCIPSSLSSPCPCICCPCLLPLFSPLLQVFLSASGSSKSRDQVWSPAASFLPHRALWCWAHSTSAAASPP